MNPYSLFRAGPTWDHHFIAAPTSFFVVGGQGVQPPARDISEGSVLRAADLIDVPSHRLAPGALPPDPRDEERAGKAKG
ncbi:hypothetical protein J2129_000670 [Methanofollis sp. W23]|nr:hypothetical protein [Methanofollis sp. W23]